ncbi:ATP-dependent DNA helicase pif3 [Dionaea muscipula]
MTKGKVDISQNKPSIACAMESIFHDYSSLPVGSCAMELDQGDDSVSWFDYQIVEPHPLQDDYPSDSDLPHGVSAVTANEQSSKESYSNEPVGAFPNRAERLGKKNQRCAAVTSSNPPKSTLVNSSSVKLAISRKDGDENGNLPDSVPCEAVGKVAVGGEKTVELVYAASSVCSGNSVERSPDDPKRTLGRKCSKTGDSERPSKVEVFVSVYDATNLIALTVRQTDKASMLDESIEYLKTLQHQVQILSMGSGMFMPPMMLPAGMKHPQGVPMPPFSRPIAVGMSMGMGFGMSMLDMSLGLMLMPPIQGVHYPCSAGFHGMAGSTIKKNKERDNEEENSNSLLIY